MGFDWGTAAIVLLCGGVWAFLTHDSRETYAGRKLPWGVLFSRGELDGVSFSVFYASSRYGRSKAQMTFELPATAELEFYVGGPWPPDRPLYAFAPGWAELPPPPSAPDKKAWGRPPERAAQALRALPAPAGDWHSLELRGGTLKLTLRLTEPLGPGEFDARAAALKNMTLAMGIA